MVVVYVLLVIAVVVVVSLLAASLGNKRREPRRKVAWAQISSLIGGTFSSTSGLSHNRHKIDGSYEGVPVEVFVEGHDAGEQPVFYTYHLKIKTVPRRDDWTLRFGNASSADSEKTWQFECKNETLRARLDESVPIELARMQAQNSSVLYRGVDATLEYKKAIDSDTSVPTLAEFEIQFRLLKHLVELNEKLNGD